MIIGGTPPALRRRFLRCRRLQQKRLSMPNGSPWVSVFRHDAHTFFCNSRATGDCSFDLPTDYAMITTDLQLLAAIQIQVSYRRRLAVCIKAALAMQCLYRRHGAKKDVARRREKFQHRLREWRHARRRVVRVKVDLERVRAATTIQTFYRGCQVRVLLRLNRAALTLQTAYRGHQVRHTNRDLCSSAS